MFREHEVTLEVRQQAGTDVYRDRVRVPEVFRGCIREGRICKVSVGGQSALLEVRGLQTENAPIIRVGDLSRRALGLEPGKKYAFCIREVWWIGQFAWAWRASDPASRIAARLGILSVALGFIGVALGLFALFRR
jgi:hypothetical protein